MLPTTADLTAIIGGVKRKKTFNAARARPFVRSIARRNGSVHEFLQFFVPGAGRASVPATPISGLGSHLLAEANRRPISSQLRVFHQAPA
jgi:hypothetical protein